MKNKKVYLEDGKEVELLTQFQDEKKTNYVVKVVVGENDYDEEVIYENQIVSKIYESYNDIPIFLNKTKLESEVEELEKRVKELTEQKVEIEKELKSVYKPQPQFKIGTPVYSTMYGNEVEKCKIIRIIFTEEENISYYTYCYDKSDGCFENIGDGCYLTKEEAEKARQKYLEKEKIEKEKEIKERLKKAKKEYEAFQKQLKKTKS